MRPIRKTSKRGGVNYNDHLDQLLLDEHTSGRITAEQYNARKALIQNVDKLQPIKQPVKKQYKRRSKAVYGHNWSGIVGMEGKEYVGACIAEWVLFLHKRYTLSRKTAQETRDINDEKHERHLI